MTRTRPFRRMILHFSHMGLTDGRTFTVASLSYLIYQFLRCRSGDRFGPRYRTQERHAAQNFRASGATCDGSRGAVIHRLYATARPLPTSCHGVRIRAPEAVMAIVNSKWAASEPSWE